MSPAANTQKNNPRLLKARAEAEAKRRAAEQAAAAHAAAASVVSDAEGEAASESDAVKDAASAGDTSASSADAAARCEETPASCASGKDGEPADGGTSGCVPGKRKQFKGKRAKAKADSVEDRDAALSQEHAIEGGASDRDQASAAVPESDSDAVCADEVAAENEEPCAVKPARKKSVAGKKRAVGQASAGHGENLSEKEDGKAASGASGKARLARAGASAEGSSGKRKAKIVAIVVCALVVIAALGAAVGGFAFARWFAHDDAVDFTGTWYISGTDKPVVITESAIELNDEVSYAYTLDADAKTLTFSFGNMTGNAMYRFSLDRSELAVADGEYSWGDTLSRDIGWYASAFAAALSGGQSSPAFSEDGMLLTRTSASMQALVDQAKADQEGAGSAVDGQSSEGGSVSSSADNEPAA